MVKYLTAIIAAAVLAAGTISAPTKAEATPAWVIPAIVVASVGGVVLGSAAVASSRAQAYEAPGTIYVQPRAAVNCQIVRERTASGGWRRVEICQ